MDTSKDMVTEKKSINAIFLKSNFLLMIAEGIAAIGEINKITAEICKRNSSLISLKKIDKGELKNNKNRERISPIKKENVKILS